MCSTGVCGEGKVKVTVRCQTSKLKRSSDSSLRCRRPWPLGHSVRQFQIRVTRSSALLSCPALNLDRVHIIDLGALWIIVWNGTPNHSRDVRFRASSCSPLALIAWVVAGTIRDHERVRALADKRLSSLNQWALDFQVLTTVRHDLAG